MAAPRFNLAAWHTALERRHRADLEFAELRRAIQALSVRYVERRDTLRSGGALNSRGKRAAFAAFYTPLHVALVGATAERLAERRQAPRVALDLACGTGAAGIGWRSAIGRPCDVTGVDLHPWALAEARWNAEQLGLRYRTERADLSAWSSIPDDAVWLMAWSANELDERCRNRWLERMLERRGRGGRLVIEPISRRAAPWWPAWEQAFLNAGGRSDSWTLEPDLPDWWWELDRAAGLRHRRVKLRSLWIG